MPQPANDGRIDPAAASAPPRFRTARLFQSATLAILRDVLAQQVYGVIVRNKALREQTFLPEQRRRDAVRAMALPADRPSDRRPDYERRAHG